MQIVFDFLRVSDATTEQGRVVQCLMVTSVTALAFV